MKLQYRGVSYEYDSSKLESQNRSQRFKQVRGSGPAYNLIYRGVTYRIDPNTKMTRVFNSDPAFRWMYPKPHQYLTNFLHFGLSIRW